MNGEPSTEASPAHASSTTGIPRPVWYLGWTSLFTDAATEMIYPLLPIYLSRVLGAGAVSLGIIDHPLDLLLIEAAVAVMVVQALLVHRLSGTPYPLWDAPPAGR